MKMDGPCGNRHHRVDVVDTAVWNKLTTVLRNPALLAEACSLGSGAEGVDWASQAEGARRKLAELARLEAETLKRHRRGLVSAAALDRELEEIARERKLVERNLRIAEEQLGDARSRRRRIKDIEEQAALLVVGLARATFEERRSLVQLLLPGEHGCFVKLHKDGGIEIQGILPTPTTTVEIRMKVAKSG
jgi:hypothetical protein